MEDKESNLDFWSPDLSVFQASVVYIENPTPARAI